MFRKTLLVTLTVLMLLSTVSLVSCTKSDSDAIKDAVRSFSSAWNARDFDRCLELVATGEDDPAEYLEDLQRTREEVGEMTIKHMEEPVITGSTATISVQVEYSWAVVILGPAEFPLVKEDGDWKLVLD